MSPKICQKISRCWVGNLKTSFKKHFLHNLAPSLVKKKIIIFVPLDIFRYMHSFTWCYNKTQGKPVKLNGISVISKTGWSEPVSGWCNQVLQTFEIFETIRLNGNKCFRKEKIFSWESQITNLKLKINAENNWKLMGNT